MMRFKPKKTSPEGPINSDLPDNCLALIFGCIQSPKDRVNCSLVCTRWLWLVASVQRPPQEMGLQMAATVGSNQRRLKAENQCKLSGRRVTNQKLALISVLYGPKLQKLELHDISFDRGISLTGLEALAMQCPLLQSLTLSHSKDLSSTWLCKIAQNSGRLSELRLKTCPRVNDPGIVAVMSRCTRLRQLHISRCRRLTGDGWLFGKNAVWTELAKLRLEDCKSLGDIPGLGAPSVLPSGQSDKAGDAGRVPGKNGTTTPGDESDCSTSERDVPGPGPTDQHCPSLDDPTGHSAFHTPPEARQTSAQAAASAPRVGGGPLHAALQGIKDGVGSGRIAQSSPAPPPDLLASVLAGDSGSGLALMNSSSRLFKLAAPKSMEKDAQPPEGASLPKLELIEFRELPMFSDLALEALVRQAPLLRHLTMAGNLGCGREGMERLAQLGRGLTYLCLMSMPVEDAWLLTIIRSCRTFKDIKLKELPNLSEASIGTILANCPNLKRLRVSKCLKMQDAGLKPAILGSENSRRLGNVRSLGFKDMMGLGDQSLQAIAAVCTALETLSLTRCGKVTNTGVLAVVRGQSGARLKKLGVKGCNVTNTSLSAIGTTCHALQNLDLIACQNITKSGITSIIQGCNGLKEIRLPRRFKEMEVQFKNKNVKVEYSEQDVSMTGPSRTWRSVLCALF